MTTNPSTKQSIASSIASLALKPAETLGNSIASMMDTPSTPSIATTKKGQIDQSLDHYENSIIESKKHSH